MELADEVPEEILDLQFESFLVCIEQINQFFFNTKCSFLPAIQKKYLTF